MNRPAPRRSSELKIEDASSRRRLDCAGYGSCLSVAVERDWDSFTCSGCDAFVKLDAQQLAHDLDALLELMAAVRGA